MNLSEGRIHGYKTHGPTKKLANKHGVHRMYAWNGLDTPTITTYLTLREIVKRSHMVCYGIVCDEGGERKNTQCSPFLFKKAVLADFVKHVFPQKYDLLLGRSVVLVGWEGCRRCIIYVDGWLNSLKRGRRGESVALARN